MQSNIVIGATNDSLAQIDKKKLAADLQANAIIYAKHFQIVPVYAGEKRAIGEAWQNRPRITPEAAEFLWRDSTNNIGLQLGTKSGTIDLECDGPDAEQDYLELFDNEPPIAPTYQAARGKHRLFADDPRLPAEAVTHYKGLEIRLGHNDRGAQSLLPPSVAKSESGELVQRKWLPDLSPEDVPLAKLTDKAIERIIAHHNATRKPKVHTEPVADDTSPGNIFNAQAQWDDILSPHGWTYITEDYQGQHFRRPGKRFGTSATAYHEGGLLYLHSDAPEVAPLEGKTAYTKFTAYTILNHNGDFSEAAKELVKLGYVKDDPFALPDNAAEEMHKLYGADGIYRGPLNQAPGFNEPEGTQERPAIDKKESGSLAKITDDALYAYLWEGNHARYVTDQEREKRIESTREALAYVPNEGYFRDYLAYMLPTTDAPVWFHIAAALSVASHIVNRKAWLQAGTDIYLPNLWIGLLAQSTTDRKSSTINGARKLIRQDAHYGDTLPDDFTMASLFATLGTRIKGKQDTNKDLPTLLEVRQRCLEESIADYHYSHGVGFFHFNEISTLLAAMNKTHNEGGKNLLTDLYDYHDEIRKETTTQGCWYIHRPFISILGASTVDWLTESCHESDLMGGFLPRWLFFTGAEKDFTLAWRDRPDEEMESRLKEHLAHLKGFRGEVTFTEEAADYYNDWHKGFTDEEGVLGSWTGRLAVTAQKIALVFEATSSQGRAISLSNLQCATKLIDRSKADLRKLLQNDLTFNEGDKLTGKVIKFLANKGGSAMHSEIMVGVRGMNARTMPEAMNTLHQRGQVRIEPVPNPNGTQGRRYSLTH